MQVSCSTAGRRRWVVLRFEWKVKDWMALRRTASLEAGALEGL